MSKYNAFISYSHHMGSDLAPSLETGLEKFAKPLFKKRALDIFRDSNDLSASPDLWGKIVDGLNESEYVIFLASPAAAQSHWCKKEVEHWKETKSMDNFLIVLADGELVWDEDKGDFDWQKTTAIPENLSGSFRNEPLYVDFRGIDGTMDLSLENPDFKNKLVLLAATLHNKSVGDMVGEAARQHRKTLRIRNATMAVLTVLLGLSILKTWEANKQTKIAVREKENAQKQTEIAKEQRDRALTNYLNSESNRIAGKDPTIAMRLAEFVSDNKPQDSVFNKDAHKIYATHFFYTIIGRNGSIIPPIAYSPDGTKILGSSSDGVLQLWDSEGKPLGLSINPHGKVSSLAFSPDGTKILTGLVNGTTILLDQNGSEVMKFEGNSSPINSVSFSPDGSLFLTGSAGGIALLRTLNGTELLNVQGPFASIQDVAFTRDGDKFLIGSGEDGLVVLIDLQGTVLKTINMVKNDLFFYCLAFSPDGTGFLTGSDDGTVRLWNLQGRELKRFKASTTSVYTVAFSRDGERVLAGYADGSSFVWDLEGNELAKLQGYLDRIGYAGFSPDGTKVITYAWDDNTYLWDLQGAELKKWRGHMASVNAVAFSPDGTRVLTGSLDRTARLWDLEGNMLMKFESGMDTVSSVAFAPDGNRVLVGYRKGTVRLWDLMGNEIRKFDGLSNRAVPIVFSPDGNKILIASKWNGDIQLWNLQSEKQMPFETKDVTSIAFSPDGSSILVGYTDGVVRLLDLQGKLLQTFENEIMPDVVISVGFAPHGAGIMAFYRDLTGNLWDLQGNILKHFEVQVDEITSVGFGNMDAVFSAPFAPDGSRFQTISLDGNTRLWDIEGNLLKKFDGAHASSVAFSDDGSQVIIGSKDGSVSLWLAPIPLCEFLDSGLEPLSAEWKAHYGL